MHNKEYALKLVQEKLNGVNNYSYSQISSFTGYTKMQLIRFSKVLRGILNCSAVLIVECFSFTIRLIIIDLKLRSYFRGISTSHPLHHYTPSIKV